jgi:hypothetical protein
MQTLDERTVSTTSAIPRYQIGKNSIPVSPPASLAIQIPLCDTPMASDTDASQEHSDYSPSDLAATGKKDFYHSNVDGSLIPLRAADLDPKASSKQIFEDSSTAQAFVDYAVKNTAASKVRSCTI